MRALLLNYLVEGFLLALLFKSSHIKGQQYDLVINLISPFSLIIWRFLTLLSLLFLFEGLLLMRGERDLLVPNCLHIPPFIVMVESISPPLSLLCCYLLQSVRMHLWFLVFTIGALYFCILGLLRL